MTQQTAIRKGELRESTPGAMTESIATATRAIQVLERDVDLSGFKHRQLFLLSKIREAADVLTFLVEDETAGTPEPWER